MVARESTKPFSSMCLSCETSAMYVYKIFEYKCVCGKSNLWYYASNLAVAKAWSGNRCVSDSTRQSSAADSWSRDSRYRADMPSRTTAT